MKARIAKKILKGAKLYWLKHYLSNDHRWDKAISICRRNTHRIAYRLGTPLHCNTCKWSVWKETANDIYRDCINHRRCLYCNRWEIK